MVTCVTLEELKKLKQIIVAGEGSPEKFELSYKSAGIEQLRKIKEEQIQGCDQEAQKLLEELISKYLKPLES
jgi:hypothetical protein